MKIQAQIKEFTNDSGDFTDKVLNTNVTVANGQVLVLGGFIKTNVSEDTGETPGLSRIPIFGWFFKSKKRTINKSYIFFFISPTLMKPRKLPGMELYTKMKLHEAADGVEEAIETKNGKDPIANWFFNAEKETYAHKIIDYANARYQPTTVDIEDDPYYRGKPKRKPGSTPQQEEPRGYERPAEITLTPDEPAPRKSRKPITEEKKSVVSASPETNKKNETATLTQSEKPKDEKKIVANEPVQSNSMVPAPLIQNSPLTTPKLPTIKPTEPSLPIEAPRTISTPKTPIQVSQAAFHPETTTIMQQRNRLKEILARNQNLKNPYTQESIA